MIPEIKDILDTNETIAKSIFDGKTYPWEVLSEISEFILKLGPTLPPDEYDNLSEGVWVAKDANVFPSAYIGSPCIIDHGAELRHCAFIRGSAIIGKNSVVGNSVEVKNAIIFNNCEVPHYNYVGDSVLGFHAHMGAGSVTSNVKADRQDVVVKSKDLLTGMNSETTQTGRRKFGAILGDWAEIGCNAVLNPGTIVGSHSNIYPTSCVRGVVPSNCIYKDNGTIILKR